MTGDFEQARAFFIEGLEHYQAGRFLEAEAQFAASLALLPGRVSTLTNLGAARLKLGQPEEAAGLLEQALAQEPDNVEALGHRATALAELGRHAQALECIERVLRLQPGLGTAWSLRGNLLKDLGRFAQAAASFEQSIARGADTELNRYSLAALTGRGAPAAPPREYVEGLFDSYADGFEEHLLQALHYRAHHILVDELRAGGRRFARALDLGCGTGLCGRLVKPLAGQVDGVDVSLNMVERASALGIYDEIAQADLVDYLQATPQRYDLVLAGDVFIYVGALEEVFAGVARVLEPGGVFCFSVEEATSGRDLELRPSLRYAHSAGYIRTLAEQFGFEISRTAAHSIREDQAAPILGLFAWLIKH